MFVPRFPSPVSRRTRFTIDGVASLEFYGFRPKQEIDGCRVLEELILSENELRYLPDTIGSLAGLSILKLQNNQIDVLTPSLAECISLAEIDVSNNPLDNIPEGYYTDTTLILWICQLQMEQKKAIDDLEEANADLEDHMRHEEEVSVIG